MKRIITIILFSLFISNLHSQVLKDFRITKCYYDSTKLYFEYEFKTLEDIKINEFANFSITTCPDKAIELAVSVRKFDFGSLIRYTQLECNITCDMGYYMSDIDGYNGRTSVKIKKGKTYTNKAFIHLLDLFPLSNTPDSLIGTYEIKLVQPLWLLKDDIKRSVYSELVKIELPAYSYDSLFSKRYHTEQ
ncbi:MAG: hypothetical protein ACOVO1_05415 [Chitinophagaceae bacterium]